MYRISKVLNHNTVIAIKDEENKEYLIMGKGIGFGKKWQSVLNLKTIPRFTRFRKQKKGVMQGRW